MAKLVLLKGGEPVLNVALSDRSEIAIGGRDECTLHIPDLSPTEGALLLRSRADRVELENQGNSSARLNGNRIEKVDLAHGDEIVLTPHWTLRFENLTLAESPPRRITQIIKFDPQQNRFETLRATVVVGSKQYALEKELVSIGSNPENDILLAEPFVSGFHARITLDANGYRLTDLESTNGTWVDGMKITDCRLGGRHIIKIGRTELQFRLEQRSETVAPATRTELGKMRSSHPEMHRVYALVQQVAPSTATICLVGESGTGKEVFAETIHQLSHRSSRPFVAVNCAALKAELIESELFGHERGAFTSAIATRRGAFEVASGGTLFLDEIGELEPELQAKLLRALEAQVINRLGSHQPIPVDVRVITATNRNLPKEIEAGRFREDLYYRLCVIPILVPPLRERTEDIIPIAQEFLAYFHSQSGKAGAPPALTEDARRKLLNHPWPGNIRELRNLMQRLVLQLGDKNRVLVSDIEFAPRIGTSSVAGALSQRVELTERERIELALNDHGWNKTKTALYLGMAKSTLYDKISYYQLKEPCEAPSA